MELKHGNYSSNTPVYFLLIVPYGIETGQSYAIPTLDKAFNRTLWN